MNDGVSVSGNPASGLGVVQLNGASNVTIDGDNPNSGGTNRDLTIQNTATNTTTYGQAVRIALATAGNNHADNDTIKNLNLIGSATGRNSSGATSTSGSEILPMPSWPAAAHPRRPGPRRHRLPLLPLPSAPGRQQII